MNELKLIEIFDACQNFLAHLDAYYPALVGKKSAGRRPKLSREEAMALLIFFHYSGFRCFKRFYTSTAQTGWLYSWFPNAPSYPQFVQRMPQLNLYLWLMAQAGCRPADEAEACYIDAKPLPVCHIRREHNNKTFKGLARKGKSSMGWFFGFKLHALIDNTGGLVNFCLTRGNVADNNAGVLRQLLQGVQGKVYGDKGYLAKIAQELENQGIQLITKLRKNMKRKRPLQEDERFFLRQRGLIESCFNLMTSILHLEHTRHRSPLNFLANTLSGLCAWHFYGDTPRVDFTPTPKIENCILLG